MREIRRAEDAERADPPYAAPVTTPDHAGVVRRPWSDLELPEDEPLGGPVSWARDTLDRTLNPNAIDHRHPIDVDRPDLPERPPMHYDRPRVREGERHVDPPPRAPAIGSRRAIA